MEPIRTPQQGRVVVISTKGVNQLVNLIESTGHRIHPRDKKDLEKLEPPNKKKKK